MIREIEAIEALTRRTLNAQDANAPDDDDLWALHAILDVCERVMGIAGPVETGTASYDCAS